MVDIEAKVKAYPEVILERGQRIALKLGPSWVFGVIQEYEDIGPFVYNRINEMATGASTFSIGTAAASTWNKLTDSQSNEILWEDELSYLMHTFIGISPPSLRLFRRYPAPVIRGNLSKIKVNALDAEAKGYVDGDYDGSPFDIPTSRAELLIPPRIDVDFGLYNPLGDTVVPQLKIFIRRYEMKYYNPSQPKESAEINKIVNGILKAHWWSPGIEPFNYDIQSNLNIKGVTIDWKGV